MKFDLNALKALHSKMEGKPVVLFPFGADSLAITSIVDAFPAIVLEIERLKDLEKTLDEARQIEGEETDKLRFANEQFALVNKDLMLVNKGFSERCAEKNEQIKGLNEASRAWNQREGEWQKFANVIDLLCSVSLPPNPATDNGWDLTKEIQAKTIVSFQDEIRAALKLIPE